MATPVKPDIPGKTCKVCGAPLVRKRYGKEGKTLESYIHYLAREHCSQSCANTRATVVKDTHHWRARQHRAEACEECGTTDGLHVHHVDRNPENNDPANLRTLCGSCHLKLHWREDRAKRLAVKPRRVLTKTCEVCSATFHPSERKVRTCSPKCKAALLSRRATQHYADPANRFKRGSSLNTSGHRGVSQRAGEGKWRAYAKLNGRFVHLGHFDSMADAVAARAAFDAEHQPPNPPQQYAAAVTQLAAIVAAVTAKEVAA